MSSNQSYHHWANRTSYSLGCGYLGLINECSLCANITVALSMKVRDGLIGESINSKDNLLVYLTYHGILLDLNVYL